MRLSALLLLLSVDAFAGTIFTVRTNDNHLMAFDTRTQTFTDVGDMGFDFDFGGLAADASGSLYIVGGRNDQNLRRINLPSATATLVGSHGIADMFGLAWDPNTSALWGFSASTYMAYTLNTGSGVATPRASVPFYAGGCFYHVPAGGIVCDWAGAADWYLFNTTTLTSTLIAPSSGYLDNTGAAYDPDTNLVWTFDWSQQVCSYDPVTLQRLSVMTTGFSMDGAELAPGSGGPSLHLGGSCPSSVAISVTGLTPSGNVAIIRSNGAGSVTVPAGPCAGTPLGLSPSGLGLLAITRANSSGAINYSGSIGAALCSKTIQILDLSTCQTTNIDTF